jgi:hypothetical protein
MVREIEMLCYSFFEHGVGLLLQDTKTWQVRWRPILVVKAGKIEAFMTSKRFVCDNLDTVVNQSINNEKRV